jgi:hypothetical protein
LTLSSDHDFNSQQIAKFSEKVSSGREWIFDYTRCSLWAPD